MRYHNHMETTPTIRQATAADLSVIHQLICATIRAVYPYYYPTGVVESFIGFHAPEHIAADIEAGNVWVIEQDAHIVGTGTAAGNELGRMYVTPACRGQGLGTQLLNHLESVIARTHATAVLDASWPAFKLYRNRGYTPVGFIEFTTESTQILTYFTMQKPLSPI
jgi:GNAT superfamily N-acetyltransferase